MYSNSENKTFTKENLDFYLNELSKEIKAEFGKHIRVELVLVGGAAALVNYQFRNGTMDIDAYETSGISIKDAINRVGDKYDLPNGWLNFDFKKTSSFSANLNQYSKPYKTFRQVLSVRSISAQYFIAMKLASNRKYKHDLSDIVGTIQAMQEAGMEDIYNLVDLAVKNLYGGWDNISSKSIEEFKKLLDESRELDAYEKIMLQEYENKIAVTEFTEKYPDAVKNDDEVDRILQMLIGEEEKKDILSRKPQKEKEKSD